MKNLLTTIKSIFTPTTKSCPVSISTFLRGDDLDSTCGTKFHSPYQQSAWIYVAITVLANTVAQIPFRISRGKPKGDQIIESGPVIDLFKKPYPGLDRSLFWQTLVSWECLRGEYFILPVDSAGKVTALGRRVPPIAGLVPLNPDHFAHIVNGHELIGWRYKPTSSNSPLKEQLLLPEEVIHARTFNPYTFWRGLSPLGLALLAAESDFAAAQFMKALMQNNAETGLVVTTDSPLTQEQCEQFRAALRARKRGMGTVDQPVFLAQGMSVEKPTISSADMQFLDNRRMNREEIGAIYKVPESMMGFGDEKSGLSAGTAMQQDRLNFIENTITGLCRRLESALEPIIKSFDPELHGWFDVDSLPIMQTARRDRLASAATAFAMGVPFNEINELFCLGFRPLPWGNKGYVNQNMVELGEATGARTVTSVERSAATSAPGSRMSPELATARMLQLVEQSQSKGSEKTDVPIATDVAADVTVRAPNKLRRFLFEQRNRALEQLEQEFGFLHVRFQRGETIEPLLDIDRENQFLFERLGLADGLLVEENEKRLGDLNDAVRKGLESDEDFAGVAERIKRIYQKN